MSDVVKEVVYAAALIMCGLFWGAMIAGHAVDEVWSAQSVEKGYAEWVITDSITGTNELKWKCDIEESKK